MEVTPRLRMFISHAHEEAKLALILKERIKQDFLGLVSVFASTDRGDLSPGADWLTVLKDELSQADVHAILCSQRSLQRPWVNIELGGALFRSVRPPKIIPLCHSQVEVSALELPIGQKQAITISDAEGLKSLYGFLADEIGCFRPTAQLADLAKAVREFEEDYRVSASRQEDSEQLLVRGDGPVGETIKNPQVLCISSRQLEETAKADFEMIRRALPMNLYHEVVVTSKDLSRQLGTKHYTLFTPLFTSVQLAAN